MKIRKEAVFYSVCLILLVIGILYDAQISKAIVSIRTPTLDKTMIFFSLLGSWLYIIIITLLLFLFFKNRRRFTIPALVSLGVSALVTFLLKAIIERPRPFETLGIINLVEENDSSMPSGHATAVFSILPIVNKAFSHFRFVWIAFSVIVAFSRIYLGVHYLTDVVAGALIGYTVGLLMLKFRSKLINEKNLKV